MLKDKFKPNVGLASIILIAVCGLLIAVDLLTKHFEEACFWNVAIIRGWIEIVSGIRNPGCAFSFLDNNPDIGQPVLITLTCVMLAVLIAVFVFLPEKHLMLKISVTFVIAGAFGNLVDRFIFREVRDFIGLNMTFSGNLVYCNLADFFIVIGAIVAIVALLFVDEWAVFPLTKKAKAAQAERKREQETNTSDSRGGDAEKEPDPQNSSSDGEEAAGGFNGGQTDEAETCADNSDVAADKRADNSDGGED